MMNLRRVRHEESGRRHARGGTHAVAGQIDACVRWRCARWPRAGAAAEQRRPKRAGSDGEHAAEQDVEEARVSVVQRLDLGELGLELAITPLAGDLMLREVPRRLRAHPLDLDHMGLVHGRLSTQAA